MFLSQNALVFLPSAYEARGKVLFFTGVCLSTFRGGYPIWATRWGVPHPRSSWEVPPFQLIGGGYSIPGPGGGRYHIPGLYGGTPSQVQVGGWGYPHPDLGWSTPHLYLGWGTPLSKPGMG